MQFALILNDDLTVDSGKRKKLIETVRHTRGVLNLDEEMAENGLLLAELSSPADADRVADLDGIATVEGMGVKHAWAHSA